MWHKCHDQLARMTIRTTWLESGDYYKELFRFSLYTQLKGLYTLSLQLNITDGVTLVFYQKMKW